MADGAGLEGGSGPSRWSLIQFTLLACYTVGFHGITSFPYYIYRHSGLFLVAYYVLVVLICIPVCYVQIKLGALYKRGIVGIFSILVPILKGAAVSLLLLTYIRCLLHGVELSYALYFSLASLQFPLPWKSPQQGNSTDSYLRFYHRPADKYFHEDFLQKSADIGEGGYILWYIALCILATWVVIYFLTFRGTALLPKISYVLTPVTLLTLVTVLIYGYAAIPDSCASIGRLLANPGQRSEEGHQSMKLTEMVQSKLGSPKPWIDALHLHINSLGLWSGLLPTLGTLVFNRKYVINASWILLLLVYSILPQVALFALAPYIDPRDSGGFIAASKGIRPGWPFLFVAIPSTLERLELSPFISFCLFLCIFLFGLHHQALHLLAIWENLLPSTPTFLMTFFRRREFLVAGTCFISFLLSIPYAIQGGIHLFAIVNDYVDRLIFTLIIISTVPFLTGYIKQELLYLPIERAFMSLWYGLSSLISAVLLIYYFAVYVYPVPVVSVEQKWAENLGWCIAATPIIVGLGMGAAHAIYNQKGSFTQRLKQSLKTDSFDSVNSSNDVTSGGTGDTGLNPVPPPVRSPSREPVGPKTETEVFVRPLDNGELAKV